MKKFILFLTITIALSSCNAYKSALKYLNEKCHDSTITKQLDGSYKVSIHCTDLYATAKVKEYLPVGKVTYNVSEAELSITGISRDSVPDVVNILKGIANGIKK